ncbi:PRC-barrel domain-containing protein [Breoghania sp.]|uniref:PRC-barrel domain-containing protein n=1 Tax=Breoghania sp. TaxID=2065378 RepID=UPI002AAB50EA|nr:PRC-barrel domain-containing protein [Breoghania sp.]
MIRALLTTTALTAMLTTGALATEAGKTAENAAKPATAAAASAKADDMTMGRYIQATKGQIMASSLMGKTVYNGTGEEAEAVGDINDVVITPEGEVAAVVIGAGGFLGVGEREIAVNFDRVAWTSRDGERILSIDATREDLEAAPAFDRSVIDKSDNEMHSSMSTEQTASGEKVASNDTMSGDAADSATLNAGDGIPVEEIVGTNDEKTFDSPVIDKLASNQSTDGMDGNMSKDQAANKMPASEGESTMDMTADDLRSGDKTVETMKTGEAEVGRTKDGDLAAMNVDPSVLSADEMIGTVVYGADGNDLGDVSDVIVSPEGELVAYIIDVGGFLGLGEKPVALDASNVEVTKDAEGELSIHIGVTEKELKAYPTYSEEAYKANPEAVVR